MQYKFDLINCYEAAALLFADRKAGNIKVVGSNNLA